MNKIFKNKFLRENLVLLIILGLIFPQYAFSDAWVADTGNKQVSRVYKDGHAPTVIKAVQVGPQDADADIGGALGDTEIRVSLNPTALFYPGLKVSFGQDRENVYEIQSIRFDETAVSDSWIVGFSSSPTDNVTADSPIYMELVRAGGFESPVSVSANTYNTRVWFADDLINDSGITQLTGWGRDEPSDTPLVKPYPPDVTFQGGDSIFDLYSQDKHIYPGIKMDFYSDNRTGTIDEPYVLETEEVNKSYDPYSLTTYSGLPDDHYIIGKNASVIHIDRFRDKTLISPRSVSANSITNRNNSEYDIAWTANTGDDSVVKYTQDWQFRKPLYIDPTKIGEPLTNFPLCVKLDSSRIDYGNTKDHGEDIRFTDSKGTPLRYEIEKWTEAEGDTSVVWVKIPQIDDTDTTIYIYYGNPNADDNQDTENVWDENYVFVQHLEEDSSDTRFDSTFYKNHGTPFGVSKVSVDKIIDGADEFADGDSIIAQDSDSLDITDTITIEAWIKGDFSASDMETILTKGNSTNWADNNYSAGLNAGGYPVFVWGGGGIVLSDTPLDINTWYHLAFVADETGDSPLKIYINDELAKENTRIESPDLNDTELIIGTDDGTYNFTGTIDEVRISNIARSKAWLKASYYSENDELIDFGGENEQEIRYAGVLKVGGFNSPQAISVNSSDGSVWVADTGDSAVVKLYKSGHKTISGTILGDCPIGSEQIVLTDISEIDSGIKISFNGHTEDAYTVKMGIPPGWWDTRWIFRKPLVFAQFSSGEKLDYFPVMVKLTPLTDPEGNFDYSKSAPEGADIRFVDTDGTALPYEIEEWKEDDTSIIWVNVPNIPENDVTDSILMYYGYPQAPNGQRPKDVWDYSHYVMVQHLQESCVTSNCRRDSTSNYNNGTPYSNGSIANLHTDLGQIDGADEFNGVDTEYVEVTKLNAKYDSKDIFTVEGWFKTANDSVLPQTIVGQWDNVEISENEYIYFGWQVLVEKGSIKVRFGSSGGGGQGGQASDGKYNGGMGGAGNLSSGSGGGGGGGAGDANPGENALGSIEGLGGVSGGGDGGTGAKDPTTPATEGTWPGGGGGGARYSPAPVEKGDASAGADGEAILTYPISYTSEGTYYWTAPVNPLGDTVTVECWGAGGGGGSVPSSSVSTVSIPYTSAGTTIWTAPSNLVGDVIVECWGAGGGGGSTTSPGEKSGGGGGGAYSKSVITGVDSGDTYTIVVGAGGTAGVDGGNSTFDTTVLVATGGKGVAVNTKPGGAGGSGGTYNGGTGGTAGTYGGGGGGGAGDANPGGNGGVPTAGVGGAGTVPEKRGGNGGTGGRIVGMGQQASPTSGTQPGGGGGGAAWLQSGPITGAAGAAGKVILTYTTAGNSGGGGGGGGAYSKNVITVTPGETYTIVVGAGGMAGVNGEDSTFDTTTVVAKGGNGVAYGVPTGGAGGLGGTYNGGTGGDGVPPGKGGGGGGGAGDTNNGGDGGTPTTAGIGGSVGGGDGGEGGVVVGVGQANGEQGTQPGGGGGGSTSVGGSSAIGGTGANGKVILTTYPISYTSAETYYWTAPENLSGGTVTVECRGAGGGGGDVPLDFGTASTGGGGGGGAYSKGVIPVTPGETYTVVVGAGGKIGENGGDSTFNATDVVAKGGGKGTTITDMVGPRVVDTPPQFHHFALVYQKGTSWGNSPALLYVDGKLESTGGPYDIISTNTKFRIGDGTSISKDAPELQGGCFEGAIDEVRISDVVRSDSWLKAQYKSMKDEFIDYTGAEESIKIIVVPVLQNYVLDGSSVARELARIGGFTEPVAVAVDSVLGNCWVIDAHDTVIWLKGDIGNVPTTAYYNINEDSGEHRIITGFNNPVSIAADPLFGDCWVACNDSSNSYIVRLDSDVSDGYALNGNSHTKIYGFDSPNAVSIDPSTGECYVADGTNGGQIVRLSPVINEISPIGGHKYTGYKVDTVPISPDTSYDADSTIIHLKLENSESGTNDTELYKPLKVSFGSFTSDIEPVYEIRSVEYGETDTAVIEIASPGLKQTLSDGIKVNKELARVGGFSSASALSAFKGEDLGEGLHLWLLQIREFYDVDGEKFPAEKEDNDGWKPFPVNTPIHDATPQFRWNYIDIDGSYSPLKSYQFQIYTLKKDAGNNKFVEIWDSGEVKVRVENDNIIPRREIYTDWDQMENTTSSSKENDSTSIYSAEYSADSPDDDDCPDLSQPKEDDSADTGDKTYYVRLTVNNGTTSDSYPTKDLKDGKLSDFPDEAPYITFTLDKTPPGAYKVCGTQELVLAPEGSVIDKDNIKQDYTISPPVLINDVDYHQTDNYYWDEVWVQWDGGETEIVGNSSTWIPKKEVTVRVKVKDRNNENPPEIGEPDRKGHDYDGSLLDEFDERETDCSGISLNAQYRFSRATSPSAPDPREWSDWVDCDEVRLYDEGAAMSNKQGERLLQGGVKNEFVWLYAKNVLFSDGDTNLIQFRVLDDGYMEVSKKMTLPSETKSGDTSREMWIAPNMGYSHADTDIWTKFMPSRGVKFQTSSNIYGYKLKIDSNVPQVILVEYPSNPYPHSFASFRWIAIDTTPCRFKWRLEYWNESVSNPYWDCYPNNGTAADGEDQFTYPENACNWQDGENWLGTEPVPAQQGTIGTSTSFEGLDVGKWYRFRVKAKDLDGAACDPLVVSRRVSDEAVWVWYVSPEVPNTIITYGPSGQVEKGNVRFAWKGVGGMPPYTYSYRITGGGGWHYVGNNTSVPLSVSVGSYVFEVRAMDSNNGSDPTPAKRMFTVVNPSHPPYSTVSPKNLYKYFREMGE